MSVTSIQTISPIDGSIVAEHSLADKAAVSLAVKKAREAQKQWQTTSLEERARVCRLAVQYFQQNKDKIAEDITRQMGRPICYSAGEINGLADRAEHMITTAQQALADIVPESKDGFKRFIRREPVGIVFTVAPWNYPLLTTVNSVVPAIMAGNAVLLKSSAQTPLSGEYFSKAFEAAGAPTGLFTALYLSHDSTNMLLASGDIDFCCFTGSVNAGKQIERAASGTFAGVALELGGKDPAYVRSDADLANAVENLVDGAFFNSGQSCCGIERIYVAQNLYKDFVESYVEQVKAYHLGNPLDKDVNLGPVVRTSAADWVRGQVDAAVKAGATACVDPSLFPAAKDGSPYLAPQVLVDVDHAMSVMTEESFGPVVGIMPVADDEDALRYMNDSDLGLTASIWTQDSDVALALGGRLETGTVFMNRCDYLDPALVWTGVKNTGRGNSLSNLGYEQLTQAKSYHLKLA